MNINGWMPKDSENFFKIEYYLVREGKKVILLFATTWMNT